MDKNENEIKMRTGTVICFTLVFLSQILSETEHQETINYSRLAWKRRFFQKPYRPFSLQLKIMSKNLSLVRFEIPEPINTLYSLSS